MAANTYECLFLLDPNKASADWHGVMNRVNGIIERHGGRILVSRPWSEHKLAFPIKNEGEDGEEDQGLLSGGADRTT